MPSTDLIRLRDSCNVWVVRSGRAATCIDFGSGAVLDRLEELELDRITDVVVTHYHRDGVQGLRRAADAGARIWVPAAEQDLFTHARAGWERRRQENNYDLAQETFSLLDDVTIAGTVDEYRTRPYGCIELYALPTPGHTPGSISYLGILGGRKVAFTGDLVYGHGQIWSLAATQWTYSGVEGQMATLLSLGLIDRHAPAVLLPAHGDPIDDPRAAVSETQTLLGELMELRRPGQRPFDVRSWLDAPWEQLSPHLLRNRTSFATSYALLSDSGGALLIDWGYDLWTGIPPGGERARCVPRLESIEALRRDHGVSQVEVVVTTHFHDDHVAGLNLLREVEGTSVWSPENVAPILEQPHAYDLPCLWYDPISVDRVLPLETPITWNEYELTIHPLPGHTRYAAAIEFVADARRVVATGDQQSREADGSAVLNYQYRNRFVADDFVRSAELYARIRPNLVITGHWGAHELSERQIDELLADGQRVAALHRRLLPVGSSELLSVRCTPYRVEASGGRASVTVELQNPFDSTQTARVALVVPDGWRAEPDVAEVDLAPLAEGRIEFGLVVPHGVAAVRVAVAADVTLGATSYGQQAEALVTIT
jgi:glyoxylase-like metal-dependent hydrolase (beta-lactamase superfamily II)